MFIHRSLRQKRFSQCIRHFVKMISRVVNVCLTINNISGAGTFNNYNAFLKIKILNKSKKRVYYDNNTTVLMIPGSSSL